jgi:hypothetical protein
MTIETGALEQAYAAEDTSFNVAPTLGATDGIRHLALDLKSKKNREPSPEKRGTPDESQSLPRRQLSNFDLSSIMWEPSGTLGTISNVGKFLEGGMGTKTSPALNTTVASGASATGAVLTATTGLAVGDILVVRVGTADEPTRIKTLPGANAVTWDALSGTPSVGAAVVSGVNFKFASNLTKSYSIFKYYNAGNFKQAVYGAVVDRISIDFDGTKEAMLAISGPAASYQDSTVGTVQSKPGTHTTVGSPAAGLAGSVFIDGTAFLVIAAKIEMMNNVELRNKEIGTSVATGIAGRANHRKVKCSLTFYLEDTNLIGKATANTKAVVRLMVGSGNGGRLCALMPSVEFEIPDIPQGMGPLEVTVDGVGYAVSGNDALFLGEA